MRMSCMRPGAYLALCSSYSFCVAARNAECAASTTPDSSLAESAEVPPGGSGGGGSGAPTTVLSRTPRGRMPHESLVRPTPQKIGNARPVAFLSALSERAAKHPSVGTYVENASFSPNAMTGTRCAPVSIAMRTKPFRRAASTSILPGDATSASAAPPGTNSTAEPGPEPRMLRMLRRPADRRPCSRQYSRMTGARKLASSVSARMLMPGNFSGKFVASVAKCTHPESEVMPCGSKANT
mmetsp:Transcript_41733/g.124807  ORF Transcript_41733/g.124807 Transcript_41733/m.124807 type:complete len:239 (+) Transcript_41733:3094-3810(+)